MAHMARDLWMQRLAEAVRPRSPRPTAIALGRMLQFLVDVPDHAFTDDSLQYIANRLRKTPSLGVLRDLLAAYLHEQEPQPERDDEPPTLKARREHEQRQASLRDDWDDPAGILRKVRACSDGSALGHRHLILLCKIVGKFAPQHLGLLPPRIIEEVASDPEVQLPAFVELRMRMGRVQPSAGKWDQIDAVTERARPASAYLTQEQLDAAYGRKRNATPAAAVDSSSAEGLDENQARYPARC